MRYARYSMSYMFMYSRDTVHLQLASWRMIYLMQPKKFELNEIIRLQNQLSYEHNNADIGKVLKFWLKVIVKKSTEDFKGRNSQKQNACVS